MLEGFCGLLRSIDVAKAKSIFEGSVCCFTLVDQKVLVVWFLELTSLVSFCVFSWCDCRWRLSYSPPSL